jgi:hypothetical protein
MWSAKAKLSLFLGGSGSFRSLVRETKASLRASRLINLRKPV